ncbi:hypothetical protein GWL_12680 [Herbaspirillum sp. GW103]|nr:hypothetical protein GWL_12680 [Herbaspirillum sp. GW103]
MWPASAVRRRVVFCMDGRVGCRCRYGRTGQVPVAAQRQRRRSQFSMERQGGRCPTRKSEQD